MSVCQPKSYASVNTIMIGVKKFEYKKTLIVHRVKKPYTYGQYIQHRQNEYIYVYIFRDNRTKY